MKNDLLFLDLDGTLLDDGKQVTDGNRKAIEGLLQAGGRVMITTGRPLPSALHQSENLGLTGAGCYVICYNGAQIYDWGAEKVIESQSLTVSQAVEIFKIARQVGVHIQTYDDRDVLVEQQGVDAELSHYCSAIGMTFRVIDSICTDLKQAPVKCLAIDLNGQEKLEQFRKKVLEQFAGHLDAFFSFHAYVEVVAAGIGKGQALKKLADQLQVPISRTVAVGDAANDLSMLRTAGTGIAMQNAAEDVKTAADWVTTRDNNHDGIAEVIEKYF